MVNHTLTRLGLWHKPKLKDSKTGKLLKLPKLNSMPKTIIQLCDAMFKCPQIFE